MLAKLRFDVPIFGFDRTQLLSSALLCRTSYCGEEDEFWINEVPQKMFKQFRYAAEKRVNRVIWIHSRRDCINKNFSNNNWKITLWFLSSHLTHNISNISFTLHDFDHFPFENNPRCIHFSNFEAHKTTWWITIKSHIGVEQW